jgi:hypothetical protein
MPRVTPKELFVSRRTSKFRRSAVFVAAASSHTSLKLPQERHVCPAPDFPEADKLLFASTAATGAVQVKCPSLMPVLRLTAR